MKLLKLFSILLVINTLYSTTIKAQNLPTPKTKVEIFPRNGQVFEAWLYHINDSDLYYGTRQTDSLTKISLNDLDLLKIREKGKGLDFASTSFYTSSPLLAIRGDDEFMPPLLLTVPLVAIITSTGALVGSLSNKRIDYDPDTPNDASQLQKAGKLSIIPLETAQKYAQEKSVYQEDISIENQDNQHIAEKSKSKLSGYTVSIGLHKVRSKNAKRTEEIANLGFENDGQPYGDRGITVNISKPLKYSIDAFAEINLNSYWNTTTYKFPVFEEPAGSENSFYDLKLNSNQLTAGINYRIFPFQQSETAKFGLLLGGGVTLAGIYTHYFSDYDNIYKKFFVRPGINLKTGLELKPTERLTLGVYWNAFFYPKLNLDGYTFTANNQTIEIPDHKISPHLFLTNFAASYRF